MNIEQMRYKDYIWRNNPAKIHVSSQRNQKDICIPHSGNFIQDCGRNKRIVKGSGEFFGEFYLEDFNKLSTIFEENTEGYLSIPGFKPFKAMFHSLDMLGESAPNLIHYSFTFWEVIGEKPQLCLGKKYHEVKEGETLWHISKDYQCTIECLLEKNRFIKNPNQLKTGWKVALS
jgi:hypothetical protein